MLLRAEVLLKILIMIITKSIQNTLEGSLNEKLMCFRHKKWGILYS